MTLKLPSMPARIAKLPRDHRGYPVPYFVAWIDGKPDHRIADQRKMERARERGLCNLCGEALGTYKAFVIGPMCSINRISAEPPSHRDCAEFAVRACPFLSIPAKSRRDHNLPEAHDEAPGNMIHRNPGVALIWITKTFTYFREDKGTLYRLGDPETTLWFCEGRPATHGEAMQSMTTGLPILMDAAKAEGPEAEWELSKCLQEALLLLPPEDGTSMTPSTPVPAQN